MSKPRSEETKRKISESQKGKRREYFNDPVKRKNWIEKQKIAAQKRIEERIKSGDVPVTISQMKEAIANKEKRTHFCKRIGLPINVCRTWERIYGLHISTNVCEGSRPCQSCGKPIEVVSVFNDQGRRTSTYYRKECDACRPIRLSKQTQKLIKEKRLPQAIGNHEQSCVICGVTFKCSPSAKRTTCTAPECVKEQRRIHYHNIEKKLQSDTSIIKRAETRFEQPGTKLNILGEKNKNAKSGVLIAPNNVEYRFTNLCHFVREHLDLFDPKDVEFRPKIKCPKKHSVKRQSKAVGLQYCNAQRALSAVCSGADKSWKGWTGYYTD